LITDNDKCMTFERLAWAAYFVTEFSDPELIEFLQDGIQYALANGFDESFMRAWLEKLQDVRKMALKTRPGMAGWPKLRHDALRKARGRCAACGASVDKGVKLHVDHIKPVSKFPDLALDPTNLQVLCQTCNLGKGAS